MLFRSSPTPELTTSLTADVIIVEDDPYYFLQMGSYVSKDERTSQTMPADPAAWLASLAPSYLKYVTILILPQAER